MINKLLSKSLVEAYYTPNAQFEILFGSLLRPYIAGLINKAVNMNVEYIASEVPFFDNIERKGNEGPKADFLLADNNKAYLAELKTIKDNKKHTRWTSQCLRYEEAIKLRENFGCIVGKKLLNIIMDKYPVVQDIYNDCVFIKSARKILGDPAEGNYLQKAMKRLKDEGQASSYKYLFTLAQIADFLAESPGFDLWNKTMDIIYILPKDAVDYKERNPEFYEALNRHVCVNFAQCAAWLAEQGGYGESLAHVINMIYRD